MSMAKREIERIEALHGLALALLMKTGAVAECDEHDYPVNQLDSEAIKDAYKMANSMISRKEIDEDRMELQAAIKSVLADAYLDCPDCMGGREED